MEAKPASFEKDGRPVSVCLHGAEGGDMPVIYMLAGPDPALELTGALNKAGDPGRPFAAVAVGTTAWNDDYSPWPAEPAFRGEPPFTGGAGGQIGWLTRELIPCAEARFPQLARASCRILLGYSLAGLAALYAMYTTDIFSACGCCSGSLWFDGWTDFMMTHRIRPGCRIYLSLGRNEEKAKSPRLAAVGDAARVAHALLSQDSNVAEAALVWHDGGHFSGVPDRVAAAVKWLLSL